MPLVSSAQVPHLPLPVQVAYKAEVISQHLKEQHARLASKLKAAQSELAAARSEALDLQEAVSGSGVSLMPKAPFYFSFRVACIARGGSLERE